MEAIMRNSNQTPESLAASFSVSPSRVRLEDEGARRPASRVVDAPVSSRLAYEVNHVAPLPKRPLPTAEEQAIRDLVYEEDRVFNHKTGQWEAK
jgi:hypothetical protein